MAKIVRIFKQTNGTSKTGNSYSISIVEAEIAKGESVQVKLMTPAPLSLGDTFTFPFLLTDFQKFAIQPEGINSGISI